MTASLSLKGHSSTLSRLVHQQAELCTLKSFTHKERSEVDIRVAQEIKNHLDLIKGNGQQIQSLSDGLISLSLQHEKLRMQTATDRQKLLVEFENLREDILSSMKDMKERLIQAERKLFEVLDAFNDLKEKVALEFITQQEFERVLDPLQNKVLNLQHNETVRTDYFNMAVEMVRNQFKDQLEKVKEELTPKIPEVDPVKAQIDERFKVWKIDFDGLVKEIAILKKAVHYDQKKFENVYTLIDRLKEGSKCQEA